MLSYQGLFCPSNAGRPVRWGDWGFGAIWLLLSGWLIKTWSVMNGHKHRKGATMKYYAGLDVSLQETVICTSNSHFDVLA